jgi:hypothetical protein
VSPVVGRGWATVELDRAAEELGHLLEPGAPFVDAPRSAILGAACRIGWARADTGEAAAEATAWIVLLEPDTEGRLTETLARHGEGWVAVWEADAEGLGQGRGADGPLGRERLVGGTPATGPFRLVVAAATIER